MQALKFSICGHALSLVTLQKTVLLSLNMCLKAYNSVTGEDNVWLAAFMRSCQYA